MVESGFHGVAGAKAVRSSGHHSDFVVEALDGAVGDFTFGPEPIEDEFFGERSIRKPLRKPLGSRLNIRQRKHKSTMANRLHLESRGRFTGEVSTNGLNRTLHANHSTSSANEK
jgi:hypothetical protein